MDLKNAWFESSVNMWRLIYDTNRAERATLWDAFRMLYLTKVHDPTDPDKTVDRLERCIQNDLI